MPVLAHDTYDFQVVRRAVFWWVRVANVLTDRIFVWKKFFNCLLVDDSNTPRILVFGFTLGEIAAAKQFYTERLAITRRDRSEQRIDAWIRRFRVARHGVFHAENTARAGKIGIGQHGAGGRCGYSGQLPRASHHVEDQATRIGRRFLNQTEIELTDDIAARYEARIKS